MSATDSIPLPPPQPNNDLFAEKMKLKLKLTKAERAEKMARERAIKAGLVPASNTMSAATTVSIVEESEEKMAAVVVDPAPMARLVDVSTQRCRDPFDKTLYTVYQFELEDQSPFYLYRVDADSDEYPLYLYVSVDPPSSFRTYGLRRCRDLHEMEYVIQCDMAGVTLGDIRVMTEVLKKLLPEDKTKDPIYPNNYVPHKDRKLFCACGHIVEHGKLAAHLKTKVKHVKGDAEGKAFLDRVAEYVASL